MPYQYQKKWPEVFKACIFGHLPSFIEGTTLAFVELHTFHNSQSKYWYSTTSNWQKTFHKLCPNLGGNYESTTPGTTKANNYTGLCMTG